MKERKERMAVLYIFFFSRGGKKKQINCQLTHVSSRHKSAGACITMASREKKQANGALLIIHVLSKYARGSEAARMILQYRTQSHPEIVMGLPRLCAQRHVVHIKSGEIKKGNNFDSETRSFVMLKALLWHSRCNQISR